MNVIEITKQKIYYLETDEQPYNLYTRFSSDNWNVRIGDSDEPVNNNEKIVELESAFQKKSPKNMKSIDILKIIDSLSLEQRVNVLDKYCSHCGDKDSSCQCWNDE